MPPARAPSAASTTAGPPGLLHGSPPLCGPVSTDQSTAEGRESSEKTTGRVAKGEETTRFGHVEDLADRRRGRLHRQRDAVLLGEAPRLHQHRHARRVHQREIVHVDGDRRRMLLRQREELVAELPCRAPVHRTDHLDVDVARVTGDGTGEHRLAPCRGPLADAVPLCPGPAFVLVNGARRRFLDAFRQAARRARSTTARHRAVLDCGHGRHRSRASGGCRSPPTATTGAGRIWPRPAPRCTARPSLGGRAGRGRPGRCSTPAAAPGGWRSSWPGAGYATVGVDVDPALLDRARAKAPELEWAPGRPRHAPGRPPHRARSRPRCSPAT